MEQGFHGRDCSSHNFRNLDGAKLLHFAEQRKRLRPRRLLALGFGGASLLLTMIPVVNFIAMPASVAGATALWVRELKESA